eukprot:4199520-Pyramimonas_sp.AAC.1
MEPPAQERLRLPTHVLTKTEVAQPNPARPPDRSRSKSSAGPDRSRSYSPTRSRQLRRHTLSTLATKLKAPSSRRTS